MKNSILAFTISFFLPGFGLAYLGRWKWCFINLGIVFGVGVIAALSFSNVSEETYETAARYIRVVCASASGGVALAATQTHNARLKLKDEPGKRVPTPEN